MNLSRTVPLLLALVAMACARREAPVDGLEARAIGPLQATPQAPELDPDAAESSRPQIRFQPERLRVYRATPVQLEALPPRGVSPEAWEAAACRWTFGDGTPAKEGCAIDHVFLRGTSDERVSLQVTLGGVVSETARIVPLERLPVAGGVGAVASGEIPAPPKSGPTSFRFVLMSATREADAETWASLLTGLRALSPELVVHLGDASDPLGGNWDAVRERLAEPLRRDDVPLLWALAPADLAADPIVRRPAQGLLDQHLELVAESAFPERYALTFKGVHFTVVTGAEQTAEDLAWLRTRLTEAQIYESRVVLSHLPLHPFSARELSALGPKFKLYELLLRARTSLFASAAHGVHFEGRYGALPVLSVGRLAGPGEALSGLDRVQGPSLSVVDVIEGQLERLFAVELDPAEGWRLLDPASLPETVEVYTR